MGHLARILIKRANVEIGNVPVSPAKRLDVVSLAGKRTHCRLNKKSSQSSLGLSLLPPSNFACSKAKAQESSARAGGFGKCVGLRRPASSLFTPKKSTVRTATATSRRRSTRAVGTGVQNWCTACVRLHGGGGGVGHRT